MTRKNRLETKLSGFSIFRTSQIFKFSFST